MLPDSTQRVVVREEEERETMGGGKGAMMVAILCLWALSATTEAVVTEEEPGLMMNFYKDTCPQAEDIIREQVKLLYKRHKNTAFSWLRNIFHDCAVEVPFLSLSLSTNYCAFTSLSIIFRVLRGEFCLKFDFLDGFSEKSTDPCVKHS